MIKIITHKGTIRVIGVWCGGSFFFSTVFFSDVRLPIVRDILDMISIWCLLAGIMCDVILFPNMVADNLVNVPFYERSLKISTTNKLIEKVNAIRTHCLSIALRVR